MILRDYQRRMVSRMKKALKEHGNSLAIGPTGMGKTICLSALAGGMQPAKTLILAHREELVTQNIQKFQKVNPGLSVSLFTAAQKSWRGKVTFGMVQTLSRPRNLETIPSLDLMVIDECHHVAAVSYQKIIDAVKEKNKNCMIAGFTATPSRGDRKGLRSVFSNVSDQITLKELIDRGFLVRPRAFVVDVGNGIQEKLSHVRKLANDFDMSQIETIMNQTVVNDEVVRQWKEKCEDRRTIVFCSTVAHAEDVRDAFLAGNIPAEIITGEMSSIERAGVYRRLKSGETRIVCNCAVLTEGFDEPAVSAVVLLRPCSYKSTLIQMVGRGLRIAPPDQYPGMVKKDCIILDFGTSLLTHGNIEADTNIDGSKKEGEEPGAAPQKMCENCEAFVPSGCRECPICGYEFPRNDGELVEEVRLTEVDLMDQSPFRWVDLFGSGKIMIASGFEAWAGVFSKDNEDWFALGKPKTSKIMQKLMVGDRIQAISAADDFLRENESDNAAHKSKSWLKLPPTEKQIAALARVGYQNIQFDFSITRYSAAAHLSFQWNRDLIERALFHGN